MKKIITLGVVALVILSMVGCVNTGEIAKGKDIEELENTIERLESTIEEQNKKHYKYDELQQIYIDMEEDMKLDDLNNLISKYSPEIGTVVSAGDDRTVILIAFSKYIQDEGYSLENRIANGDYIRLIVEKDNVGQSVVHNITYNEFKHDITCEKYDLSLYDKDNINLWTNMNSSEEQMNYIIDK